jgi:hypothetical protein
MVTEVGAERLDDGKERRGAERKAERKAPLPKLCEECKAVVPTRAKVCPQCGTQVHAWTHVEAVDGELVKLGEKAAGAGAPGLADKVDFYCELRGHAKARGYADGWVAHKFREKFGHWPNDPRVSSAKARPPSLKTSNWIRSRQIAFAKARERAVG